MSLFIHAIFVALLFHPPITLKNYLAPPQYLADVDEVDDGSSFNPYAVPDPDIVRMKAERKLQETSENQKLLKDALQDLSGDESPPQIPKRKYGQGDNEASKASLDSFSKASPASSSKQIKHSSKVSTSYFSSGE